MAPRANRDEAENTDVTGILPWIEDYPCGEDEDTPVSRETSVPPAVGAPGDDTPTRRRGSGPRRIATADDVSEALAEALADDPSDERIAWRLLELGLRSEGAWEALVEQMARALHRTPGPGAKIQLAEWVVRWARGEARDAPTADRFLAIIRSLDATHPLVHERRAHECGEVGAWDSRRDELQRALARAEKPADRSALHAALGELFEVQLPNEKRALDHYEKAIRIDSGSVVALTALERIYRRTEQFGRLAETLALLVDALPEGREQTDALLRLAELLERKFLKPRDAAPRYEDAQACEPDNVRALDGLERCYRALRDWDELAGALERRVAAAQNPREATAALVRLAQVYEAEQDRPDAALAAWQRVFELDSTHGPAVQELARLCEKQGDVGGAAAYRSRLADLSDDPQEKARIHVSVGEMLAPEGRDPASARMHFERAIEMDPRNVSAWENLQKLALRGGDCMYATFCLERRAQHADSPRLKGQLLVELANMRASLGDPRGALATFEFAFESDPTNEIAARAVLDEWTRLEKWEDVQRACDLLVAAATRDRDDASLLALLRLATRAALSLGNPERALQAAAAAHKQARSDPEVPAELVAVCHELRDRPSARERVRAAAQAIARHAMDLPVHALVQLGEVRLAIGDRRGGIEILRLALARDAENRRALATLASAYMEQRDWAGAASCQHSLARLANEGAEQHALYLAAAEVWEKRARIPSRAAIVLEEAHERNPRDAAVLHRLVAVSQSLGDWEKLARALRWLADLEQDPGKRAKHLYAVAGVVREKVGDHERAAVLYDETLDADPTRLEAFERIVRLLTELRDWEKLERAYTRMIGRVRDGRDPKLLHALYHQLGLLLRDRAGDIPRALAAFRLACAVCPQEKEDQQIVVELLLLTGQDEGAISELRAAARTAPLEPEIHRKLYELHLKRAAHDRAWCAANVLVHLGAADDAQRRFVADFAPVGLDDVPGTLAACAWRSHLLAHGLDERLTTIFRFFVPGVVRARLGNIPANRRMRWLGAQVRDTDSPAAARLVRVVGAAAEILGVPRPMLLARPHLPVAFAVAPTPTPALFVSMPAVEALPSELLVFVVGRRLAELRSELVAHALFPTPAELKTLLKTALRVAVATPAAPPQNRDEAAILAALEEHEIEGLRAAVSTIVGAQSLPDVATWLRLADLSASRAGLLLCGDFDRAWRAIQREPRSPGDLAPSEWRKEMSVFAVSDGYADLRDAIGVNVEARC
jgi:tetratricopeptide (TPR) repeat protein